MHLGSSNINVMRYLIVLLCALSCTLTSCRPKSGMKSLEERRPLRYYKGYIVVAIYKSSNTIVLASDSVYNNIAVTDYELNSVTLGDTVK